MSAEISAYLDSLRVGDIVSPESLAKKAGRSLKETYLILEKAKEQKAVRQVIKPCCSACGAVGESVYYTMTDVPDDVSCGRCGRKLSVLDDMLILYQKIRKKEKK